MINLSSDLIHFKPCLIADLLLHYLSKSKLNPKMLTGGGAQCCRVSFVVLDKMLDKIRLHPQGRSQT